jgi:phospholipid-translocating ATPase
MLLMCLWVVVYSFFESIAFNQEVVVLFSTVGFWFTVVFSIILALGMASCFVLNLAHPSTGPRFVVKFINEAYFPADRHIIREAWVVGDLKDRLGIQHRRSSRGKTSEISQMEDASLFRPHLRAASDNSSDQDLQGYEPVALPTSIGTPPSPTGHERRQPTTMSYYSASDIPEPETIPPTNTRLRPPVNLHPSSAEQRRMDKPIPSPITTSPIPTAASPTSPTALSPTRQTSSPARLSPSATQATHGEYEMQTRPLRTPEQSHYSRTSKGSFVTASDGGWESENDDVATVQQHGR